MKLQTHHDTLDHTAKKHLHEQGWLVLTRISSTESLAAMHQAWEVAEARTEVTGNNWGPCDLQREPAFQWCLNEERVLAALRILLKSEPVLRSFKGRSPPQGLGQQGLHADWSVPVPPTEPLVANAFWVLDDMDSLSGATRLVPGSHYWQRLPKGSVAQPAGAHPEEILIRASAGDVLVFSAHLWHSGTKNISGARRRLAVAQFSIVSGV
jgi:ectoine hydroxylase-related dioxygenase (phytanoyl-CoA dioxygenase family)